MSANDEKLIFIRAIGQVVMTWISFLAIGLVTLVMLSFFIYCVMKERGVAATAISGVLNGLLLALLQIIYKSLFPSSDKAGQ